jgi:DNA-directed RNA polymerase subunit omega
LRSGSKFSLVTLAAKRARQINSYYGSLKAKSNVGSLVPPQVTSTARTSLSIAFEEIDADMIEAVGGATGRPVPGAVEAETAEDEA